MENDRNEPNPASAKEPAEGSRETAIPEFTDEKDSGTISNRPPAEERQNEVPARGDRKPE
jgi:hypothetical protein